MKYLHKMIQVIIFKSSDLVCSYMKDNIQITALKKKWKMRLPLPRGKALYFVLTGLRAYLSAIDGSL